MLLKQDSGEPQVALISGSSGDLGGVIAKFLSSKNMTVVGLDKIPSTENHIDYDQFTVDLACEGQTLEAIESIEVKYGKINVLVNAAGTIHSQPLVNLSGINELRHNYETFKKVVDSNLNSTFLLGSLVAEKMLLKRVRGRIINFSSICSRGAAGQSAYAASKAAVEALTKVWAKELGGLGITVNAISPGFIDTKSTSRALSINSLEQIRKEIPLRKLGSVENVCRGVEYLISNEYVNGTVLAIDGGMVL